MRQLGGDQQPKEEARSYHPETQKLIDELLEDPTQALECVHGPELAAGIYEVPDGCVAFPGLVTQALCPEHVIANGSLHGMNLVVDLSANAGWSINSQDIPDYCMVRDEATNTITMMPFIDSPFCNGS